VGPCTAFSDRHDLSFVWYLDAYAAYRRRDKTSVRSADRDGILNGPARQRQACDCGYACRSATALNVSALRSGFLRRPRPHPRLRKCRADRFRHWVWSRVAGAVAPAAGSALDGYWGADGSQHVNFVGTDGHVHELYIAPGRNWVDNDLTTLG
jgi:hypothetical protein